MKLQKRAPALLRSTLLYSLWLAFMGSGVSAQPTIRIDGTKTGRTFEGIGALSAGASSRLLVDYPEPYRSDILDFLFKPGFGANLHQLKVETGGDINSTDGSELSYAHTPDEFLHPRKAFFDRGYEWWLIKEAKKRNPDIKIEILQWGAPGWVGDGKFYSEENAQFIAGYIKGLEKYHGITVDYTGIRNEVMYDISWIKLLRKTLDSEGLVHVKIDVGDQWKPGFQWKIARDIAEDASLARAVYAINAHVPEETHFRLPDTALGINKPLWSGESHITGGDWSAAAKAARINNRSYALGRLTKVIYWSLVTSYPDFLTAPQSGVMEANTPWSGNYTVQPPLWIDAHTNQFARPGWKYVEDGCKYFKEAGWSVITLKDTATDDYSIIIETMDAKDDQTVHFKLSGGLSGKPLTVWRSVAEQSVFERQPDIVPHEKAFAVTLRPHAIYSLTTTRGQHKGRPAHAIPPPAPFPTLYKDDFEHDSLHREPRFFINYHGAFEVVKDDRSGNRYLKQCSLRQGINWFRQPYPRVILGDSSWKNTRMSVDFLLPDTGWVGVEARLNKFPWNSRVNGYRFNINDAGGWKLQRAGNDSLLQQGTYRPVKGHWHHLQFDCRDDRLTVWLDRRKVVEVSDHTFRSGIIALSSGWNEACFDNFEVRATR